MTTYKLETSSRELALKHTDGCGHSKEQLTKSSEGSNISQPPVGRLKMEGSQEQMSDIRVISLHLPKTPGTSICGRIRLVSKFWTNDWYFNLSYATLPTTETRNDLNIRISLQILSLICRLNIMEDANTFAKTNEKEFGNCLLFRSAGCQEGGEEGSVEDH